MNTNTRQEPTLVVGRTGKVRDDFVTPWVAWDIVRTLATTAVFGSLT